MKLFDLAGDQFNLIDWDSPDIAHVLATMTSLNSNISTRVFASRERGDDWREVGYTDWLERVTDWTAPQIRAEVENESNFTGLARLVQKCPRLQDFAYQALGIPLPGLPELKGFQFLNWKILQYVSELPSLPKLNRSLESNMQKLEVRGPIYQMGLEERGQVHFQRQLYDEDAECCAHLRRQGGGVRRPIHFHLDPQGFVDLLLVNSEFDSSQAHTF
ncbi:hypothetical protein FocTR4_00015211 [Fusarium oxysporum f. sp. cubense]|nr:hypothetical protein FocTR4_00015211 [Fusarium oxysporum f. sp. cubense]